MVEKRRVPNNVFVEVVMKNNYCDLLVPVAFPGCKNVYEPLEWAKKFCPSYITNDAVQKNGDYYYRFYFGNQRDLIAFTLKWL